MDFASAKRVLHYFKGPETEDVIQQFDELYQLKEAQEKLNNIKSVDDIHKMIEIENKKINKLENENALYAKKVHAISEIVGLIVIKPQKTQFSVFEQRRKMYKFLSEEVKKKTDDARNKLAQKHSISPALLSRKKPSEETISCINEYIESQGKLESMKIESSLFNQERDARGYALIHEVKDLHNVCVNQGIEVSEFDQAHFMSEILGI